MANRYYLILLFCIFYLNVLAQSYYDPMKIQPSAPTAASLGAFGNSGSGSYTGSTDIQVPVYQIQTTQFNWGIQLRYNYSGLKPAEDASWVGLGWALEAGGVITRSIRGFDDFTNNVSQKGYYYAESLPDENSTSIGQKDPYLDQILEGDRDSEPDIFSYNFGNYAGKFVLGKQADGSLLFLDNRNNLKIQFFPNSGACTNCSNWVITDANGFIYYFDVRESSTDYSYWSDFNDMTTFNGIDGMTGSSQSNIMTWHLSKAISPNGEELNFTYVQANPSIGPVQRTEAQFNLLQTTASGNCSGVGSNLQNVYKKYTASRSVNYEYYLDKVTFAKGTVEFIRTTRTDIASLNSNFPQSKLSEVVVKDLSGRQVKKIALTHSYFTGNSIPDTRLKLDAVREYGNNNIQSRTPYLFTYYEANSFPQKYTKAIDHWGYYNGSLGNSSLLTAQSFFYIGTSYTLTGADRVSGALAEVEKGALISIQYPTGGHTDFEYELHDFCNWRPENGTYTPTNYSVNAEASSQNMGENGVVAASFTLSVSTTVHITCDWVKQVPEATDFLIDYQFAWLEKDGLVIQPFNSGDATSSDHPIEFNGTYPPGQYFIKVRYVPGYLTTINAGWSGPTSTFNPYGTGGGIRVKRIKNYDRNTNVAAVRRFLYNNSAGSTGRLMSAPRYSYFAAISQSSGACLFTGDYFVRVSGSIAQPGLTSNNVIGYDVVTELIGENGEGGKTEYIFYNDADIIPNFPNLPTIGSQWNGRIKARIDYDASLSRKRMIQYLYSPKESFYIRAIKLYSTLLPQMGDNGIYGSDNHQFAYYDNYSGWLPPSGERETIYTSSGDITTIKNYYYENNEHKQVTGTEIIGSDGKTRGTAFRYPHDFSAQQPYTDMVSSKHIWSPIVEETSYVNNALLQSRKTNYAIWNGTSWGSGGMNLPLPQTTDEKILTNNYQTRYRYHSYDNKGNIVDISKENDQHEIFIWGNNKQYPALRATNALSNELFFDSFEEGTGWDANLSSYEQSSIVHSGKYSGKLAAPYDWNICTSTKWLNVSFSTPTKFKYSGWVYSNGPAASIYLLMKNPGELGTFTYSDFVTTNVTGKWVYLEKEFDVPASVIQMTIRIVNTSGGDVWFDDIRLHRSTAQVTGFTYDPLVGLLSQTDINSRFTFYEYDAFGQLRLVRDHDRNVIRKICYNYSGQPEVCDPMYLYVKIAPENITYSGNYIYGDVVVRFYQDAACTIPATAINLNMNFKRDYYSFGQDYHEYETFSFLCNGTATTIRSQVILQFNDSDAGYMNTYRIEPGNDYEKSNQNPWPVL